MTSTNTQQSSSTSNNNLNGIVRRFSHNMLEENPGDPLTVALASQEARDEEEEERQRKLDHQWKSLFIPGAVQQFETEEETKLDKSSQELAQAWEKFQKYLPESQRSSHKDKPPNFEDVAKAVANANAAWKERQQSKLGKTKTLFANVCETMNDYKHVMAPIPSQDKYFSLLTGTFSVIVTATINHKKTAEGVSSCLEALGDDIGYWKRQLIIHNDNNYMKKYVAQLYVLIFQLLIDILHWFKSGIKRFVGSFDEQGFDKLVKSKKDKMQALAQKLENEGKLATEAKIKSTEEDVKALLARPEQPNAEDLVARFLAEIDKRLDQHEQRLGKSIQQTLRDEAKSLAWELQNRGLQARASWKLIKDEQAIHSSQVVEASTITKEQLQSHAHGLRVTQQIDLLARLVLRSGEMDVNMEVLRRVKLLLANSTSSQSLWVCGPSQVMVPSRMTLTASNLWSAARKAGIPTIAFFCQREDTTGHPHGPKGVTKVVYSIISQLVDVLSEDIFENVADFSEARFAKLNGSIESLPAAMSLLRDLLTLRPPLLFCFFDGFHLLGRGIGRLETRALAELIELLRKPQRQGVNDGAIETLYTTDGFLDLLGVLRGHERLILTDFDSEDRIGRGIDSIEL